MINNKKQITFTDKISLIFKKNLKVIIFLVLSLLVIIIFFQYSLYKKENKVLKISILYDQAKTTVNLNDFEEKMNLIAKENGIFGILASLDLIKKSLSNNDYNYAYNVYLKLLKSKDSNRIYNSIIALHGSYNLIDNVSSDKVSNLLSFVDESSISFMGYKNEVEYLLSIKNNNLNKSEELSHQILNNESISEAIKERVRKINEFEKYK
tara:strand:- start:381 stop:1007 length:627 start_codon:yes stop_codon:yes gene_type:complete